jgi:hypothetical protein
MKHAIPPTISTSLALMTQSDFVKITMLPSATSIGEGATVWPGCHKAEHPVQLDMAIMAQIESVSAA